MQQFTIILLLITGMCFFLGFKNRRLLRKVGRKSYFVLTENDESLEMNIFDRENPRENHSETPSDNEEEQTDTVINYKDNLEDNVTNM